MRQLPPDQAQRRPRQSTGATLHSADTLPAAQMNQVARLIITRVPQVMRPNSVVCPLYPSADSASVYARRPQRGRCTQIALICTPRLLIAEQTPTVQIGASGVAVTRTSRRPATAARMAIQLGHQPRSVTICMGRWKLAGKTSVTGAAPRLAIVPMSLPMRDLRNLRGVRSPARVRRDRRRSGHLRGMSGDS